jgi:3-oxoacyl-[acyl-carrier protein] reductase
MQLQGKKVLITGGTKGIGAATATLMADHGADVAINGRHNDDAAQEVLKAITALGRKAAMIEADVSLPADCERCVDEAVQALGGLDVLIHNAGDTRFGTIEETTPDQWHHAFAVHVHAAYYLCRRAIPHLKQAGEGAIVLVSSVAGIRGSARAIAYGTAKGAIVQFTRMLARDVAADNIRVNCIAPGIISTRLHDYKTPDQRKKSAEERIPLRREGEPKDVAELMVLLATNEFMTGECVSVDGGTSMQLTR